MNVRPTVVRLSVEMIARIEAVAGKHRMSQFLREAAEAELLRREAKKVQKPKPGLEAAAASHDKPKPRKGSKPKA